MSLNFYSVKFFPSSLICVLKCAGHLAGEVHEEPACRGEAGDGGHLHPEGRQAGPNPGPGRLSEEGGGLLGSGQEAAGRHALPAEFA